MGPQGGGAPRDPRRAGLLAACGGHPLIVQIRDNETSPPTPRHLWRSLSEVVAGTLMRHVAGAVKKMHDAGMVHRDGNMLVALDGALRICNLGGGDSAVVGRGAVRRGAGRHHAVQYSSPEQLVGSRRHYGPAVDMRALWCVIAELLSGHVLVSLLALVHCPRGL